MQKKTDLQSKNLEISQSSSLYANQQPYHQPSQSQQQPQQQRQQYVQNQQEDVSGRSDDWCSESSSGNVRQLGQQSKGRSIISIGKPRKFSLTPSISNVSILTSNSSKDNSTSSKTITEDGSSSVPLNGATYDEVNKKPLIAKWKTGVRLQNATSPSTDGKGQYFGFAHLV